MIKEPKQHPLVEKYFHTFNDEREVIYQGRIINELGDGYFLTQLYEWFFGDSSCQRIFHISEMNNWQLYENQESMKYFYEEVYDTKLNRKTETARA